MLKIRPGYDTVTKTLRLPEGMTLKLESIVRENKVSFTSVVVQCLEYALEHMDAGDSMERAPAK